MKLLFFLGFLLCLTCSLSEVCTNDQAPNNCKFTVIGGGFGGLYSAFRAYNSSLYQPQDICIFEKTDRVGGRAYSVRNVFPITPSVDIGAHRYDRVIHRIMSSIVNILGLNTRCYSKTLDCVVNDDSYFFLRNSYSGNLATSQGIPYFLNKNEQWKSNTSPPNPSDDIINMYPFYSLMYNNLTSLDPSVRYPTIRQALEMLRNYQVNGLYPNQMDIKSALPGYSSELWYLYEDVIGESPSILHINLYDVMRFNILYALDDVVGEQLNVITDSLGNEVGYATVPETLASYLTSKCVNLSYNKEAAGLYKNNDGSIKVTFSDGTSIDTDNVILNIPQRELLQLSHDSVIFTHASTNQTLIYKLFNAIPAVKAYGFYSDNWWNKLLGITMAELATTEFVRYFEYTDSNYQCSGNKCPGYVNIAYPDDTFYRYFSTPRTDETDPLVVIYSNTTDLVQKRWLNDVTASFIKSQTGIFASKNVNPSLLPALQILVMGVWNAAWHQSPIYKDFRGGDISKAMLNPVPGVPIYVANEAFSVDQGWAEGSLIAAEKILYKYFGLNRPSWLADSYWHDAIIKYEYV